MLVSQTIAIVCTTLGLLQFSTASSNCDALSSKYFQWLNTEGELVLPAMYAAAEESSWNTCDKRWQTLPQYPSCQFCSIHNSVVCHSTQLYRIPDPSSLPVSKLSLYSLSGAGLVFLPPRSFSGLTIQQLIIESTNLTFIGQDTFTEVKSVKFLFLRNNIFEHLSHVGNLLQPLQNLKALILENNKFKTFLSFQSAGLKELEYFSLRGSTVHMFDVFFLQNSRLSFLDLSSIKLKDNFLDLEDYGFSSLPINLTSVDLSYANVSVKAIGMMFKLLHKHNITTLNLGYLKYSRRILSALYPIRNSLQRLSLQGTDLSNTFTVDYAKSSISSYVIFINVTELNLMSCKINYFRESVFRSFPNVKVLSLADNHIKTLDLSAFIDLNSLSYLDLKANYIGDTTYESNSTLESVQVLDLSLARFNQYENSSENIFNFFVNIQMLSLCNAQVSTNLILSMQNLTKLQYLDSSSTLSNSNDILFAYSVLFSALKSSLIELYFARNYFKPSQIFPIHFSLLKSLKTLDLSNNMIRDLSQDILLPSVSSLILSQNLITTWYSPIIHSKSSIKFLDLSNNQITYVSEAMVHDFYKLESLNLIDNPLMCHNKVVAMVCADVKNETHNLTMVSWQKYKCYDIVSNNYRLFSEPEECDAYYEEVSTTSKTQDGTNTEQTPGTSSSDLSSINRQRNFNSLITLALVILGALSAIIGCIVYFKWWSIKCYVHRYFSLRRAHLLRKEGPLLARPDVHYDVFVSYSDVDRSWILDHLIPNMEADGDVTLCFHERDFQVGLSILENIIECMDRSHSILLVVSSGFVRSKWCQFEMHLAQYRLIETLRNQLVLVLLEDIPKKSRPSVLHHLMMTKTYLVWPTHPCKEDAKELFWKRLKRALKPNYSNLFGI